MNIKAILLALTLHAFLLSDRADAQLEILLSDQIGTPTDVLPRLLALGHSVTVSSAPTWGASYDYSPYDVVAFEFRSENPGDIPNLVAAVDAGVVGVVFFRGFNCEPTLIALGLSGGSPVDWQTPTDLDVLDNSHCITAPLTLGIWPLGYTYMTDMVDPGANTTTLASGPDGGAALVVHNTRRAAVTPFYGHSAGYDTENSTGLMITERTLQWAAGNDCMGARYCATNANSTGSPALLTASGSNSIAQNNLDLSVAPVPDQPGIFYFGPNAIEVPFGNGFLCVGSGLVRLLPPVVASGNVATRAVDTIADGITVGTLHFQYWHRDPPAGGAFFNTSDAISVTFFP